MGLGAAFGVIEKEYYCEVCHYTWPKGDTLRAGLQTPPSDVADMLPRASADDQTRRAA
jgi:hypothetical protein